MFSGKLLKILISFSDLSGLLLEDVSQSLA